MPQPLAAYIITLLLHLLKRVLFSLSYPISIFLSIHHRAGGEPPSLYMLIHHRTGGELPSFYRSDGEVVVVLVLVLEALERLVRPSHV